MFRDHAAKQNDRPMAGGKESEFAQRVVQAVCHGFKLSRRPRMDVMARDVAGLGSYLRARSETC